MEKKFLSKRSSIDDISLKLSKGNISPEEIKKILTDLYDSAFTEGDNLRAQIVKRAKDASTKDEERAWKLVLDLIDDKVHGGKRK